MKTHQLYKSVAALLAAMLMLTACADKDNIAPTGMIPSSDGTPIRYQSQGDGKTAIVFVHCWTCDHSFWNEQYNVFADKYKVVRLDLAGHGGSANRKQHSINAFANDVVAVVDALKLQRVILVGHSMGGPVSVAATKQLGKRVAGVVGVDTFHIAFEFPRNEEAIRNFAKPFEDDLSTAREDLMRSMFAPGASEEIINKVVAPIPKASHDMAVQAIYDLIRWSNTERGPLMTALGDRLKNINGDPLGSGEPTHDSVTLIKGAGHFLQMEKPQEFNRALRLIIQQLDK